MKTKHDRAIVLDFDHTVFNTTKYVKKLKEVFKQKFDIDNDTFMKHREYVKKCCVVIDFDKFVDSFEYKDNLELHHAIEKVVRENAHKWVFDDVIPFMEKYKDEYDIIVETHGDKEQQEEKINHSNLPHYIEYIISTEGKDKVFDDLEPKYDEIHFFDDKAKNIDAVKQKHPKVTTYFVQRPEDHPYADKPSKCSCDDYVVHSLEEVQL